MSESRSHGHSDACKARARKAALAKFIRSYPIDITKHDMEVFDCGFNMGWKYHANRPNKNNIIKNAIAEIKQDIHKLIIEYLKDEIY